MMIIDSHVHLFSLKIIENVTRKKELVKRLSLQAKGATDRLGVNALSRSMQTTGVAAGLILPTAGPLDVARVNEAFLEKAADTAFLHTAGTLHPDYPSNMAELEKLHRQGVKGIKLCSFSQGFVLDAMPALALFDLIQRHNQKNGHRFFVVLDTFYLADQFFGTDPAFTTTPAKLCALVRRYPEINFIGAHMGGLGAPFEKTLRHLIPSDNLYLDTSNAAHTLTPDQFVELLKRFGPEQILFGTDWPWFVHEEEVARIEALTAAAGFGSKEKAAVFYTNVAALLEI